MSWKNAPSVKAALAEATRRWPNRSKASDGTIGDPAHQARASDHNPDSRGVVHAFDLTHDPANGVDCEVLAAHLVAKRDGRVKYIIWNRQIVSPTAWTWGSYTGSNPHTHHMHVSIFSTTAAEDDVSDWWDVTPTISSAAGSDTERLARMVGLGVGLMARMTAVGRAAAAVGAAAGLILGQRAGGAHGMAQPRKPGSRQ